MQAASTVIFAEYWWTPGDMVQAEDRVHRIGQPCSVLIQYLHARGSLDDALFFILNAKLENVGLVRAFVLLHDIPRHGSRTSVVVRPLSAGQPLGCNPCHVQALQAHAVPCT